MNAAARGTLRTRISLLLGMASACSLIIVIGVLLNLSRNIVGVLETLDQEEEIQALAGDISLSMNSGGEVHSSFSDECRDIREMIERYQLLDLAVGEAETVERIKEKHQDLESLVLDVSYARQAVPERDLTEEMDRIVTLSGDLDRLVDGLARSGADRIKARLNNLQHWEGNAANWTIGGGIISVVAFSIIGLLYTRRILSPLDELRAAAAQVRKGEFRIEVPEGEVDEIRRLSSSFSQMADALLQAEKRQLTNRLESIGILAGGVAHDFNNFLMAIYGSLTLARREIDPATPAAELLEEAETAALRARNLTQQLLTFSRGGKPVKKPASVRRVVQQAVEFARRGTAMQARFDFPADLWPAELDEGQVGQVFSNLAINAEQAMPDGGRLDVTAQNLLLEDRSPLPLSPGPFVKITVRDHGTGILDKHLPRIFDPYFTTKRRGSGLGLAVAQSVVTSHDGAITAESEIGSGTVFHVYLPASPGLVPDRASGGTPEQRQFGARILVMDDEAQVRKVTGMMISELGCECSTATDGEEALQLVGRAAAEGKPFDAVICDLLVPGGMGGAELARELRRRWPAVPLVAASGYSNDAVLSSPEAHGFDGGLAKPFSVEELEKMLSRLISC